MIFSDPSDETHIEGLICAKRYRSIAIKTISVLNSKKRALRRQTQPSTAIKIELDSDKQIFNRNKKALSSGKKQ